MLEHQKVRHYDRTKIPKVLMGYRHTWLMNYKGQRYYYSTYISIKEWKMFKKSIRDQWLNNMEAKAREAIGEYIAGCKS